MTLLKKININWIFFLFSLFFFACIFYLVRHFMVNLDELDNILAPFLMSQGKLFYRDIFNMHFPLPFYVAYLFSPFWVNQDPSRAIAVFRLSLLFVYFLSFFITFISFKNKKTKNTFSFWIILLSILVPLYHGNLYLSETFSTIFISSIFWLSVPIMLGWEKFSNYHLYLLIIFSSLAFWTQPLLIILFFIPLLFVKKAQFLKFICTSFFLNLIPLILFFINGQLFSFFNQTIIFNSKIYSHFFPEQIGNYSMLFQNFLSFFKNELVLLTNFNNTTSISQFLFHICLVILFYFILRKRNFKYILVFLVIFISINIRSLKIVPGFIYNFAIFPLLAVSSASVFILFSDVINLKLKTLFILIIFCGFVLNFIDFYPILKQSLNLGYNYDVFWSYRQRIGEDITKLTQPKEKILIYPHDSDFYFFSKRQPVDIFPYWYPWIDANSEYKNQRSHALKDNPPPLIYLGSLAYKNDSEYYKKLFPNLLNDYINLTKNGEITNYWLRSDLIGRLQGLNFSSHASTNE